MRNVSGGVKRLFDIFFSMLGLIMLSPLFLIVAVLIKLDSRGPVFYRQKRIGQDFNSFEILKFRSMMADADKKGLHITAGGDTRITKIGRLLRKSKIDEIPQLINVLKGNMSLVGPRPEVEKYVNYYSQDYKEILRVRPGITDISSITFRDEESVLGDKENPEEFYKSVLLPKKIILAKEYIEQSSFLFDLQIIFKTILKIIFPKHGTINNVNKESTNA